MLLGPYSANGDGSPADGLSVASVVLSPQASVVNVGASAMVAKVTWALYADDGVTIVATSVNSTPTLSAANGSYLLTGPSMTFSAGQVCVHLFFANFPARKPPSHFPCFALLPVRLGRCGLFPAHSCTRC